MDTTSWPAGRYRLLTKQYLSPFPGAAPRLMREGEEVVLTIAPNNNLEPLDDGARAGMEAYRAAKAAQAAESRRIEGYRRQGYVMVPGHPQAPPEPEAASDDQRSEEKKRKDAERMAKARAAQKAKREQRGHDTVPEGDDAADAGD